MTHLDVLSLAPIHAQLGFGLMRLLSAEETTKMVDMYLGAGFNYFDTAHAYGGSEDKLKKALSSRHPRDSYLVASKLPTWMAPNHKSCDKLLMESLQRCGLDYLDFYLVHSLDDGNIRGADSAGVFEWIAEQKKKGLCKHIGFSFHGTPALLDRLFTLHPEMEFVYLQLNYLDIMRGNAGALHEIALKHSKPLIVMEPVKGGTLANLPTAAEAIFKEYAPNCSAASWAVRYAASISGATCMLSGMSTVEQMQDNLKTFNPFKLISKEECDIIEKVLLELAKVATIPCTMCKYCLEDCPRQIDIPVCFSSYNNLKHGAERWNVEMLYNSSIPSGHRAADCTACGACVPRCPQHIDIPKDLKMVAKMFK